MKKWALFVVVVLIIIVSGCASSADVGPKVPKVLGKDGIPQPEWVFKNVSTSERHFASGYGKMSDFNNSLKRATVEAKNNIAAYINENVKQVILTYVSDAGSGDDRQALDAMEVLSRQVAEATLSGVITEEMWVDVDDGVWVLLSISLENIEKAFMPAAQVVAEEFTPNEAAEAATAKMLDAYDRLLKEGF